MARANDPAGEDCGDGMPVNVVAIVVTYNRKSLLERCLAALLAQSRRPDRILVVDNASTDGTSEWLTEAGRLYGGLVQPLFLSENTGGAGGFSAGMQQAFDEGAGSVWIMDDDAEPHPAALETLLDAAVDRQCLYGSVAVSGARMSWPMQARGAGRRGAIDDPARLPPRLEVEFIPFLGLLVSREVVGKIGLPDAGFFIAKDDVEYAFRAVRAGVRSMLVAGSRIEHPPSRYLEIRLPGVVLRTLDIPGWKRYYSVRNRILIARRHLGAALYYATLPGSLIHLVLALLLSADRRAQWRAWVFGTLDGLLGRTGRRHDVWGL